MLQDSQAEEGAQGMRAALLQSGLGEPTLVGHVMLLACFAAT